MYFHAPCGVVLYCFVCKLYANKEKKKKKDCWDSLEPDQYWENSAVFEFHTQDLCFTLSFLSSQAVTYRILIFPSVMNC